MCGIFGSIAEDRVNIADLKVLANHARQRGKDSSGLISHDLHKYIIDKADYDINKLINKNQDKIKIKNLVGTQ